MNAKIWKTAAMVLLATSMFGVIGWGQGAPVYPQGLIIDPPQSEDLQVSIWTDQAEYEVGELVTISYEVNKPAYIYIWDITPEGVVQVVFPSSAYPGGTDNFVQAGTHQLPQSFPVAPPLGTEYLQILATTRPVDVAAFPMSDPRLFQEQVEVQVLGLLLEDERTWGFTSFEITDQAPSNYGTAIITSTPSGASITLDGEFIGYTPKTHFLAQGLHRISFSKPGYATRNAVIIIFGTGTRTINAELTPLFPVNDPPNATFTYSPPNPIAGSFVQLNAAGSFDSDGSIVSYQWSFGDGTAGAGPFVSHQYTSGGTYPVTLTVTDNDGETDSTTRQIQIGSMKLPPVAAFTFDPPTPDVGVWVQFDASSSFDPDGSITNYQWSYGDGGTDTGPIRWHQFLAGGTYTVTLTVTDDDGVSSSVAQPIQVGPTGLPPVASFAFNPPSPPVGAWVQFDASASFDPDGSIASYQWSYGDGGSDIGSPRWHQFAVAGTYAVTLTVTDNDGLTSSTTEQIQVGSVQQPPVASFGYSPPAPQVGEVITLDGSASFDPDGSLVSYEWDRNGDGITDAIGPFAQVVFAAPGAVPIRLTVTDNSGLTASTTQTILVGQGGGPTGGAPPMGTTPGIFVWGSDSWHVTVNAGAGWSAPRGYRLELRTDGTFQNVNQPSGGGVYPLGLVTTPTGGGNTVLFEGTLQSGAVDHTFTIPGASKLILSLELDIDGDGDLEESSSFVYLRQQMVNPPSPVIPGDWDLTFGLPRGSTSEFLPTLDFRIGHTQGVLTIYTRSISELESP